MSRPVPDPWVSTHPADRTTAPEGRKTPRGMWHAASPHKAKSPEPEIPTLQLTHFTKKQIVCFEVAKTGRTRKRLLRLYNPHDYPQMVELERISPKKGFFLEAKMWEVPPNSELDIPIFWIPPDEGTFRDLMTLLCEDAFRLQVILLGTAQDPTRKVGGRRSTFLVKKSRPQRQQNPRTKKRQPPTAAGKENANPGSRRSPDVQSQEKVEIIGDVSKCSRSGKVTHDVDRDKEITGVPDQSTTNKALKELTNAMEPVQNVPLQNPARETLLVCSGMSPLLKSKKPGAVRKKKRRSKPDKSRDQDNPELFDDQATTKALSELTDASEPIQNVPLQNPARETVLICSGMSPLLNPSSQDVGNRHNKPRRSTAVRRVLNGTAIKTNVEGHVGEPKMVSGGGDGRVALKGTEVKVHHSRGEDLGSSLIRGEPGLPDTTVDGHPSESHDTNGTSDQRVLQGSEVEANPSLGVTGLGPGSKKALFTDTRDETGEPDDAISPEHDREERELVSMKTIPPSRKEGLPTDLKTPDGHLREIGDVKEADLPKSAMPSLSGTKTASVDSPSCCYPSTTDTPEVSMMEDSLDDGVVGSPKGVTCDSEVAMEHCHEEKPTVSQNVEEVSKDYTRMPGEDWVELVEPGMNTERMLKVNVSEGKRENEVLRVTNTGRGKMSLDSLEGQNNSFQSTGDDDNAEAGDPKKSFPVVYTHAGPDLDAVAGRDAGKLEAGTSQELLEADTGISKGDDAVMEMEGAIEKEENIANLVLLGGQTLTSVMPDEKASEVLETVGEEGHDDVLQSDAIKSREVNESELVQCTAGYEDGSLPALVKTGPKRNSASLENGVNSKKTGITTEEAKNAKPENQGLVFIPLDEKPKKRSIHDASADRGMKKLKTAAAQSGSSCAETKVEGAKGTRSSLSLNRTVALRRASATNTTAPRKVRARPWAKKVVKGVPMAKLHLLRPAKTALPRHPMPFAAKNMFYDERWMDKQERGFIQWLNYILTPEEESIRNPTIKGKKIEARLLSIPTTATKIQPAPTKEVLSMRAYTARRRLNQLRRCACLLFQSEPVVRVIQKIEAQVENGGLAVRTDRKIHADLGMKQDILMMILSYNPLWLRIGLETIYGELLPIEDNSDVIGLSRFIVTRLLGNPDIAQQFAHPTVPALFGPGYNAALAKFTLKKFLLLVFFLDKAKLTRLIDHDPCLFCKDAQYKSSRDLLLEFSRLYLKGEGDITRHLNYIGYSVTHTQKALDEYDFAVINLAKDLRDGIRLVRVTELLMKNWLLSRELRCPAISRLQKVHNVQVALDALSPSTNISDGGIDAKAIVDGHREKTLELLWNIIFSFKVETMLDDAHLKEETAFLWRNLQLRRNLDAVKMMAVRRNLDKPAGGDVYSSKSPKLSLLLQWCQAICAYYDIPIDNFTVSFCDGRAFCFMVHHYHPELIAASSIRDHTTQTEARDEGPNTSHDDSLDQSLSPVASSQGSPNEGASFDQLKKNEQANFKTLYNAMKSLGGVPFMIKAADMSGTIPDEKVVITYVSYVCARLLDLCKETRAVRTIQVAWRRYKLQKIMEARKVQHDAAVVIQRWIRGLWRQQLEQRWADAVVLLQTTVRGWLARRALSALRRQRSEQRQAAAAVVIQACMRGVLARKRATAELEAVLKLQALVRGWRARRSLCRAREAVRTIESCYLGHRLRKEARDQYQIIKRTAIMIQAYYRGREARELLHQMRAARTIQAAWRSHSARSQYQATQWAVTIIQSEVRMYLQRTKYQRIRMAAARIQEWYRAILIGRQTRSAFIAQQDSAIKIQSCFRGYLARRAYTSQRRQCILIQSSVRGYLARGRYERMKGAAITIQRRHRAKQLGKRELYQYQTLKSSVVTLQSALRGWSVRKELDRKRAAACLVQACFRSVIQRRQYRRLRAACVTIQSYVRAHQQRGRYLATRGAALVIQKVYRGQQMRRRIKQLRSAIRIQATYKMFRTRREYKSSVAKVITCQGVVKGFIAQRRYAKVLEASKTIQMYFRGYRMMKSAREEFCKMKAASLVIQSAYRGYRARQDYLEQVQNVVRCQAVVRGFLARRRFLELVNATLVIQKYVRAYRKMKSAQEKFCKLKAASLVIQSAYRGYRARQDYVEQVQNVVRCQAVVRGFLARGRFLELVNATLVIQKYVRAYRKMKSAQEKFCKLKAASLVIQSAYRGYRARQDYVEQVQNVVRCQAVVRGFLARRRFLELVNATLVIQKYVRAYRKMKSAREKFCKMKAASLVIQSAYRGYRARQDYLEQVQNVVRCQAVVRGFLARRRFLELVNATLVIQKYVRAYRKMRSAREKFCEVKDASLVIQTAYRGYRARQDYLEQVQKVVTCQAAVRGFLARRRFLELVNTTLVIQKYVRAYRKMRSAREKFCEVKDASLVIQTAYRGYRARQDYLEQVQKVVTCQAAVRGFLARRRFLELVNTTLVIQKYVRAYRKMRSAREKFCEVKDASLVIQTAYRGYRARQDYLEQVQKVVTCQAAVRGFLARRRFLELVNATLVIQKYVRAYKRMKTAREEFCHVRKACITIQSVYRGYRARKDFCRQVRSVITCQKLVRGFLARKDYQGRREAAIIIQGRYRAHQAMVRQHLEYHLLRGACIVLQAAYRGYSRRRQYRALRDAAAVVQSCWRMVAARSQYQTKRAACQVVQRRWRATLDGRRQRENYLKMRHAAFVLQSAYRGFQSREYVRYLRKIILCQSTVRMFIARSRFRRDLDTLNKLQARARGCLIRKQFVAKRKATMVLQCHWRAALIGRKEYLDYHVKRGGIIVIQSSVRGWLTRTKFLKMRELAVCIQAAYRRHVAVVRYRTQREAVITIQTHVRAYIDGRAAQEHFVKMRASAIVIQSYWRMTHMRKEFLELKTTAIVAQKLYRKCAAVRRYRMKISAISTIQRYVRAYLESRAVRREFLRKKNAAVSLQSWWRMNRVQRDFRRKRSSAITLQSAYRRHRAMEAYKVQRQAVLTLQSYARAHLAGKAVREEYRRIKSSVVLLQSWWRMSLEHRRYAMLRAAVITVQTHLRRVLAMRSYQCDRSSVVAVQRRWRANRLAREGARRYAETRKAVILLQALVRGRMARTELALQQTSARLIQAQWRGYSQRMKYAATKNAAVVIQRQYVALVCMRAERDHYQMLRCATVVIQSFVRGLHARQLARQQRGARLIQAAYRMYRDRANYRMLRSSVVKIQAAYRGYRRRQQYLQILSAIATIQCRFRAYQTGQSTREELVHQQRAAVVIQSYYRCHIARREYIAEMNAAIKIQSFCRGRRARLHHQRLRNAAICLQRYWRARFLGKEEFNRYHLIRGAIITIQAHITGFIVRQEFFRKRAAVVVLQKAWRGFQCRQSLLCTKAAVVCLQRRWRARTEAREVRSAYQKTRGKIVQIQSLYRAHQSRKAFLETREAAVKIQAWTRRYQCREEYLAMKGAASLIQRRWRASALARECQSEFLETRNRIILIQSLFRARRCRKEYLKMRRAVVVLQAWMKGAVCRREFSKLRGAALAVQRRWHARKLAMESRRVYLKERNQVVLIQSLFRAKRCRQEYLKMSSAVVVLQAWMKGAVCRREFLKLRGAALAVQRRWYARKLAMEFRRVYLKERNQVVLIQSLFRAKRCRQEYLKMSSAVVVLQAWMKGAVCRREFLKLREAALVIQRRWHARKLAMEARKVYLKEKSQVVLIQSQFRVRKCRREYLTKRAAAVMIQAWIRRRRCRQDYIKMRHAAITIQKWWQARSVVRDVRKQYLETREQIILIQSLFRARICRQEFLRKKVAAVLIQSRIRGNLARKDYSTLRSAALVVQRRWRAKEQGAVCREDYLNMKSATVTIQSSYRAHRCREQFLAIRRATVVIQSHLRGHRCRSWYSRIRRAAVTIQRWYRTAQLTRRLREDFELVSRAALEIQSVWRGHVARRRVGRLRWEIANAQQRWEAATRIQCWIRGRLQRVRYLRLWEGVLLAQQIYRVRHQRRVAALTVIQRYGRMWLARKRVCDINRAATAIQAIWRGRAVRKSTKSKKIARARARCLQATQAATEDKKLCNRTTSALDFLLGYKYLDQVLEAVSSLEVATRLSSQCCERLVAGQAVPVLFCLIRNCNRSLPCMEVIKHTVATLVNLAKYSVTAPSVLDCSESVSSLLELMMIYRETNAAIATRTAVLLTILGQHDNIKKIILATPKVDEKLRSLRYLHERKQKLRTQQMIAKSRTKGLGLTPSATPSKKARPRRQFQPDWVLGRDKRPEASDPLEAIKGLNNVLGVK